MNFWAILTSTSEILVLVFSKLSMMNLRTSLRELNLSTSAWKISSKLNGQSSFYVLMFDWIVSVYYTEPPESSFAFFNALVAAMNAAIL